MIDPIKDVHYEEAKAILERHLDAPGTRIDPDCNKEELLEDVAHILRDAWNEASELVGEYVHEGD